MTESTDKSSNSEIHAAGSPNSDNHVDSTIKTPSSSPKKTLKPVSPHKNGNGTVGRLSFLQSDKIDDHFEQIHCSHDEILQYLGSLEASTSQTQADIDQLFDRSKNNNQNLNKLLNGIAEYTREVTEEGNATKTDVSKILDVLHDLQAKARSNDLERCLDKTQEAILGDVHEAFQKSGISEIDKANTRAHAVLMNKLSAIETQIAGLKVQNSFGEFRSRVESLAQQNSKEVNSKLAEVLQSLQLLNFPKQPAEDDTSQRALASSVSNHVDKSINRLEAMLATQSEKIDTLVGKMSQDRTVKEYASDPRTPELQDDYDALSQKYQELDTSYRDLEAKYERLEDIYGTKLKLFAELQENFVRLGEDTSALQTSISDIDINKYEKVQELHSHKVRELRNITPLQRSARIASMPAHNASRDGLASNNSDTEW